MFDTPETDALDALCREINASAYFSMRSHASRLERERDDLLSRLTSIELLMPEELARLERERNYARAAYQSALDENNRLDKELDESRQQRVDLQGMVIRLQLELTKALEAVVELRKNPMQTLSQPYAGKTQ